MSVAFILDDIFEYPPKNGVTRRFFSMASAFGVKPNINFYIGMRGNANLESFSAMPNITLFPSKWLYTSNGFNRVVRFLQRRNTEIIHVCNAHTMAPLFGFPLAKALGVHCIVDFHDIKRVAGLESVGITTA